MKFFLSCIGSLFGTAALAASIIIPAANTTESMILTTPRGATIEVLSDMPISRSKIAAVILAPGRAYAMNHHIMNKLAADLLLRGIATFRFNWNYYSKDPKTGAPSENLALEREDLQTLLTYVKQHPGIDSSKIILAGKSLGSLVTFPVFQNDASLKALLLLTPVCDDMPADYPGLTDLLRPLVIATSNNDPLCPLPKLHEYLGNSRGHTAVVTVGGDHSWNLGKTDDPAFVDRNDANISHAVAMLSHWVDLILHK